VFGKHTSFPFTCTSLPLVNMLVVGPATILYGWFNHFCF